ncbi:MAG: glycosyltransferase family 2 protein [Candidatus Babeliales bacterium]
MEKMIMVLDDEPRVSVIVPCRNEKDMIQEIVDRVPDMGSGTDIIFVEGHSVDGTLQEIDRVKKLNPHKAISCFTQLGEGKYDAIKTGMRHVTGDIVMIVDADLTVPPEELALFYDALVKKKGDFINGTRFIHAMENGSMPKLNWYANKFFSYWFSNILRQRVTDTLCGTKVFWFSDYQDNICCVDRHLKGDPFGDFTLLVKTVPKALKIVEIPVHYKKRRYGVTKIRRFYHGIQLMKLALKGAYCANRYRLFGK